MKFDEKKLKAILLAGNYITVSDVKKSEEHTKKNNTTFGDYLITEGLLTRDLIGQAIAEFYKVRYSDLNSNQPSHEQVLKIPEVFAVLWRVVIFSDDEKQMIITTDNPLKKELKTKIKELFPGKKIEVSYSLPEDIEAAFIHYQKPLETRFTKIIENQNRIAPELLEEIFSDALTYNASDIHFEPQTNEVLVRFRVDGILREAGRIPKEHYENLLNRIKVQSGLRIDEHSAAQDGSMRHEGDKQIIDLRVSAVPTIEGEKIVLRVLAAYVRGFGLSNLGLSPANQEILLEVAKKPFGMILVTGPTGSGKTTTLYSLLKILSNSQVNVTTIEDPVEYKMLGVNQIQVNTLTGLTFAKGLRSIVRQDPDIILVGEIRDEETAEIAVNAALTGHLLLSTFHANDASTSIPRLLDMGIEPFLLASTLEVIIAQRLVRKICKNCRHSVAFETKDPRAKNIKHFFGKGKITVYEGKKCEVCNNTGYKGRVAIFEFIHITPELQELILENPSTQEIWKMAVKQGAKSMFEDGIDKVKNGVTTIEELLRVSEPPKK